MISIEYECPFQMNVHFILMSILFYTDSILDDILDEHINTNILYSVSPIEKPAHWCSKVHAEL